jgi:outer membrane protein assembly factor BamD
MADMTAHDLFAQGKEKYDRTKYLPAREYFQTIVYNFPGEPMVDTAQYFLALTYFGAKEYEIAGVEFNRLVLNYPSSAYFTHALFMRAVSFYHSTPKHFALDQTDIKRAIRQFEDFLIDYPESELIPEAREYLAQARTRLARKQYEAGRTYKYIRAYAAAKTYFQVVIDDFTDTEYGAKAAYDYAEMEYHLKNFDEAQASYEGFAAAFPDHEMYAKAVRNGVKSAFKSGEKAFKMGDLPLARQRLQLFVQNYPESKLVSRAEKYLRRIDSSVATSQPQVENADSL